jgi:hypothetical protein
VAPIEARLVLWMDEGNVARLSLSSAREEARLASEPLEEARSLPPYLIEALAASGRRILSSTRDRLSIGAARLKAEQIRREVSGSGAAAVQTWKAWQAELAGIDEQIAESVRITFAAASRTPTRADVPKLLEIVDPLIDQAFDGMEKELRALFPGSGIERQVRGCVNPLKTRVKVKVEAETTLNELRLSADRERIGGDFPSVAGREAKAQPSQNAKRFRVALSFPGEKRTYVDAVASFLGDALSKDRVLYDYWHRAEFARPNLDTHLQRLYREESDLVVVFLCREYQEKEWCGLEWRAIRSLIQQRREGDVMLFRFDSAEIPGLFPGDGHVWLREPPDQMPPQEAAQDILKRLEINDRTSGPPLPAANPATKTNMNTSAVSGWLARMKVRILTLLGLGVLLAAGAGFLRTLREPVSASCAWTSLDDADRRELRCTVRSAMSETLSGVSIEFPFASATAFLNQQEASSQLKPNPRGVASTWFTLGDLLPKDEITTKVSPIRGEFDRVKVCSPAEYKLRLQGS